MEQFTTLQVFRYQEEPLRVLEELDGLEQVGVIQRLQKQAMGQKLVDGLVFKERFLDYSHSPFLLRNFVNANSDFTKRSFANALSHLVAVGKLSIIVFDHAEADLLYHVFALAVIHGIVEIGHKN